MVRLNDVDQEILREIEDNGRATPGLLQDVVGVSRTYMSQRITRLEEHNYIEEIAPNLYDITDIGEERINQI
ncbi:winged helix-turn-helix transcriptional regulator [Halalkalicoccus subterraneus]|uniref:winged helix-turn-helix transcriptional regulator n=1 Tax=Halalkalicoccus subterraneus TaxID=2675002 RepID=UPI0013CF38EF